MTKICITFYIHQPNFLHTYRFFEIGKNQDYFNHVTTGNAIQQQATSGYLKSNQLILDLIQNYPDFFKVNFCITGSTLQLFEKYAPEVLKSFAKLASSTNVTFLGGTFSHSITSTQNYEDFEKQVLKNNYVHQKLLNITPEGFVNTGLIYSDSIGDWIQNLGFKTILTEAEPSAIGWNSSKAQFSHPHHKDVKIVLCNTDSCHALASRFWDENWHNNPLTEIELVNWMERQTNEEECTQVLLPYDVLGGIYCKQKTAFLADTMQLISGMNLNLMKFEESKSNLKETPTFQSPNAISGFTPLKNLDFLYDNSLSKEALKKLFTIGKKVKRMNDEGIKNAYFHLQALEHFMWMQPGQTPNFVSDSPYEDHYKAFINYMNVLNDLAIRVDALLPDEGFDRAAKLHFQTQIEQKEKEIKRYKSKLKKIQKHLRDLQNEMDKEM